jgi:hypothetical protein
VEGFPEMKLVAKSTPRGADSASVNDGRASVRTRSFVIVLLVAFAGRLLAMGEFLAGHPRTWLFCHPYEMGFVANSLIHGLGYSSPFGGSTGPTAIVAPGYPTLISVVFLIFGSYTAASAVTIMLLQILVSLLTIWLMMRVSAQVLDRRSAVIAGAFWAIALPLLWIPTIFWETSISACALVGMIALALRCRRSPTPSAWILLGASCAVTGLINPALLPSLLLVMGWVAYQTRETGWRRPTLGLVALAVVFAPWPIRNAVRFHAFIPLRSTVGIEMYMGNHPGSNGRLDDSLFPMFNKPELASYLAKGEVQYTADKNREAWNYIRAQPAIFVKLSLRRAYRFWSGTGNTDGPWLYEMHALLTTMLGGAGLIFLIRRGKGDFAALVALPLLLYPCPYYITHAEFRYRLNIDPVLTILAGYAVSQFCAMWAQHRTRTRKSAPVALTAAEAIAD